jgi:hypothetical protein
MTCLDIISYATEVTGDISSEALDFARRALRLKYGTLYNSHLWREAQRTIDGIQMDPTLNGAVFLPFDADEVISLALSFDGLAYNRLIYHERDWIERFSTPAFNLPGNTPWFYRGENYAWPYINPGQFTISTNEPVSFRFYVGGRDTNDQPMGEEFLLQGVNNPDGTTNTTSVTTVGTYKYLTSLSKGVTQTTVRVSDTLGNVYVMPGGSTELTFTQLILYPTPIFQLTDGTPQNVFLRVHAKLKPDPLTSDMSVPRISHIWDALITFTTAACYKRMSQVAKSAQDEQTAMDLVRSAINVEKNQAEWRQQAVPQVYERGDYLSDGGFWYGYPSSSNPFGL